MAKAAFAPAHVQMERELPCLARRLAALPRHSHGDEALVSITTGALVAIQYALKSGFSDDAALGTKPVHIEKALDAVALNTLAQGRKYLAGHYFNDALLRLDIAYENALRRLTGISGLTTTEKLVRSAKTGSGFDGPLSAWQDIVRKEVNRLKHDLPKQVRERRAGRAVTWKIVLSATQSLLPLIEKAIQRRPSR